MVVMILMGLVFMAVGIFFGRDSIELRNNGRQATGEVVDIDTSRGSKGGTTYAPVVRFTPVEGDPITFVGKVHSSSRPRIGEQVRVLYDPRDPGGAQIDSFEQMWLFPMVFGGVGFLVLAIGAAAALRSVVMLALVGRAITS
jgi:hypothetical protein